MLLKLGATSLSTTSAARSARSCDAFVKLPRASAAAAPAAAEARSASRCRPLSRKPRGSRRRPRPDDDVAGQQQRQLTAAMGGDGGGTHGSTRSHTHTPQ